MKKPEKWDVIKAAIYGAIAGVILAVFNFFEEAGVYAITAPYIIGSLIGSVVAVSFLFAVAAAIRNLFVK